jgi:hypothetical protein
VPRRATHWSTRTVANAAGPSQTAVWRAFGLQPHRQETFKLSTDPMFVKKVQDIVGLYMDPPLMGMVLCVDEKSRTQALDRTQPLRPLAPGIPKRGTHDYKRHGTTTLFAVTHRSTRQLEQSIREYLDINNTEPKPFRLIENCQRHPRQCREIFSANF